VGFKYLPFYITLLGTKVRIHEITTKIKMKEEKK